MFILKEWNKDMSANRFQKFVCFIYVYIYSFFILFYVLRFLFCTQSGEPPLIHQQTDADLQFWG